MKNYHPYIIVKGEEWTSPEPMPISEACDEAARIKSERNADEAGVKVFTQECMKILNWKEGRYWHGRPAYLYKLTV